MKNSFLAPSATRIVQQMMPYTKFTAAAVISVHCTSRSL